MALEAQRRQVQNELRGIQRQQHIVEDEFSEIERQQRAIESKLLEMQLRQKQVEYETQLKELIYEANTPVGMAYLSKLPRQSSVPRNIGRSRTPDSYDSHLIDRPGSSQLERRYVGQSSQSLKRGTTPPATRLKRSSSLKKMFSFGRSKKDKTYGDLPPTDAKKRSVWKNMKHKVDSATYSFYEAQKPYETVSFKRRDASPAYEEGRRSRSRPETPRGSRPPPGTPTDPALHGTPVTENKPSPGINIVRSSPGQVNQATISPQVNAAIKKGDRVLLKELMQSTTTAETTYVGKGSDYSKTPLKIEEGKGQAPIEGEITVETAAQAESARPESMISVKEDVIEPSIKEGKLESSRDMMKGLEKMVAEGESKKDVTVVVTGPEEDKHLKKQFKKLASGSMTPKQESMDELSQLEKLVNHNGEAERKYKELEAFNKKIESEFKKENGKVEGEIKEGNDKDKGEDKGPRPISVAEEQIFPKKKEPEKPSSETFAKWKVRRSEKESKAPYDARPPSVTEDDIVPVEKPATKKKDVHPAADVGEEEKKEKSGIGAKIGGMVQNAKAGVQNQVQNAKQAAQSARFRPGQKKASAPQPPDADKSGRPPSVEEEQILPTAKPQPRPLSVREEEIVPKPKPGPESAKSAEPAKADGRPSSVQEDDIVPVEKPATKKKDVELAPAANETNEEKPPVATPAPKEETEVQRPKSVAEDEIVPKPKEEKSEKPANEAEGASEQVSIHYDNVDFSNKSGDNKSSANRDSGVGSLERPSRLTKAKPPLSIAKEKVMDVFGSLRKRSRSSETGPKRSRSAETVPKVKRDGSSTLERMRSRSADAMRQLRVHGHKIHRPVAIRHGQLIDPDTKIPGVLVPDDIRNGLHPPDAPATPPNTPRDETPGGSSEGTPKSTPKGTPKMLRRYFQPLKWSPKSSRSGTPKSTPGGTPKSTPKSSPGGSPSVTPKTGTPRGTPKNLKKIFHPMKENISHAASAVKSSWEKHKPSMATLKRNKTATHGVEVTPSVGNNDQPDLLTSTETEGSTGNIPQVHPYDLAFPKSPDNKQTNKIQPYEMTSFSMSRSRPPQAANGRGPNGVKRREHKSADRILERTVVPDEMQGGSVRKSWSNCDISQLDELDLPYVSLAHIERKRLEKEARISTDYSNEYDALIKQMGFLVEMTEADQAEALMKNPSLSPRAPRVPKRYNGARSEVRSPVAAYPGQIDRPGVRSPTIAYPTPIQRPQRAVAGHIPYQAEHRLSDEYEGGEVTIRPSPTDGVEKLQAYNTQNIQGQYHTQNIRGPIENVPRQYQPQHPTQYQPPYQPQTIQGPTVIEPKLGPYMAGARYTTSAPTYQQAPVTQQVNQSQNTQRQYPGQMAGKLNEGGKIGSGMYRSEIQIMTNPRY